MEWVGLLWQILAFVIMKMFEKVAYVVDDIMFTLEDYEVYDKVIRSFSFCVGNFYFWQTLATIGFYHYLRRLAAKFPPPHSVIAIDVGPSMQQLVEEKEAALKEAASRNGDLDKEINGLRAKVARLEKEVDFISTDRYALVRDKCILQNKLGDFNSWPEFRVEYDQLATEFEAMKRQRAREHISQAQVLEIAKEAKLQLAEAKLAIAMSKIAHSEELKLVQQERDLAKESYRTLLAKTTTAAATIASNTITAVVTPAIATTAAATEVTPGDKVLQEENTRLTLALRSQTSLLSKKSSDLERMQALLKTRSNHSVSELRTAAATILNLEEEKEQAGKRIAELERNVQDAMDETEEMKGMYMALAFKDEGEGEKGEEEEEEDEDNGEEGADEDWSEEDEEDDDKDDDEDEDDEHE